MITSRLRTAVRSLTPPRDSLKDDALAGIPGAISSVPDGMASAVLVGVNPIHGLYASAVGPIAGGLFSSTRLMVITTTSAAALAAGSTLQDVDPSRPQLGAVPAHADRRRRDGRSGHRQARSLHALRLALGDDGVPDRRRREHHARPGARPVPARLGGGDRAHEGPPRAHAPERDQPPVAARRARRARDHRGARTHPDRLDRVARRARRAHASRCSASRSVAARRATSEPSPAACRCPQLPDFGALSVNVIVGALAVAAIVLVQGAGVSESAPTPTVRSRTPTATSSPRASATSRRASSAACPVGGSVGQTALNVASGARSRWSRRSSRGCGCS